MVAREKTRATFAEYATLPETMQIIELIDGAIVASSPLDNHQRTLLQIVFSLSTVIKTGRACIAPSGLHFDDNNSFEPDFFWVSPNSQNCFLEDNERYWHGAPDLVIEVLSLSTNANDRGIKFDTYEKYRVCEYWVVDPDAKFVEVYRHENGKFERQGVFKAGQSFTSTILNGAPIETKSWFSE